MSGPIEQFEIKPVISLPKIDGIDLSFTNSSLFMALAVGTASVFFITAMRKRLLIPTKLQSVAEIVYELVSGMINEMVGPEGRKFIPFIFSLFTFVVLGNLLGLLPYSFTYTSHFAAVGTLSVFSILVTVIAGLKKRGLNWFTNFFPKGTPVAIAPILVPIEIISFCSKPFSLTVRLTVNMMVGHIMLKVIAGFIYGLSFWGGWLPLAFISILTVFEMGIAVLQAYVYTILTCVYLSDALHAH
ncbi:MAG: F0F1 ATP synthase subunit A [Alphaproteobacteria bacterium]|nr:F0F1 ATP synthase subunit A [Alphaproteobacteria bacterium]MBO4644837.1 F0F1 ATP synthase subunit A [Alphaproteobacteria bacterium]